jgi:hypothetical protein
MKRAKPPPLMPHPFRLAKLELKPGDMVVLQTDLVLSKEQCEHLKRNLDKQLKPLKVESMVLTAGLKLGILRKDKRHA